MENNVIEEFTIYVDTVEIGGEWSVYVSGIHPCCPDMCSRVFDAQDMKVKSIGPRDDIRPYLAFLKGDKPTPMRHCIFCGSPVVIRDNRNDYEITSRTYIRKTHPLDSPMTVERITAEDFSETRDYVKE